MKNLRTILGTRMMKTIALLVAISYGLIFLFATQNLVYLPNVDFTGFAKIPSIAVSEDWPSKVWRMRGPANWEPILAIYPINHVIILISVPNLLITGLLSILVTLNITVAVYGLQTRICLPGKKQLTGILGAVPSFLTGFGCCAPTAALALGATAVAGLIAIANYLIPVSGIALLASLIWNAGRKEITFATNLLAARGKMGVKGRTVP